MLTKNRVQIDLEHLEWEKDQILQQVCEVRDAYVMNKSSYKGIRCVLAVLDGRARPSWLQEDSERAWVFELTTSPTQALMREFSFNMSEEEVHIFLDAEEQIEPLREQLRIIDAAIDAILSFNESSQI